MSTFSFRYTSQQIKDHQLYKNVSIKGAERALQKRDLLIAVEEFRQSADTDLLADVIGHIVETAL